jgi:hypothetical protein
LPFYPSTPNKLNSFRFPKNLFRFFDIFVKISLANYLNYQKMLPHNERGPAAGLRRTTGKICGLAHFFVANSAEDV